MMNLKKNLEKTIFIFIIINMKAPNIIIIENKRFYKKIIPYKYATKPFYGYKGTYISYDSGNFESLVEVVELSDWLVEKSLYDFLKCRRYI